MTSRFVYSDEETESSAVGGTVNENSTEKVGDSLAEDHKEEPVMRERLSLQEQLQNSRYDKYVERKKKLEEQNSLYKLKDDDLEYYNKIEADKLRKIRKEREDERYELEEFRRRKKQAKVPAGNDRKERKENSSADFQVPGLSGIVRRKKKPKIESKEEQKDDAKLSGGDASKIQQNSTLDLGYSSSSSDEEIGSR